jgi:hypothetical protein
MKPYAVYFFILTLTREKSLFRACLFELLIRPFIESMVQPFLQASRYI